MNVEPAITNPVTRAILVSDVVKSCAFYKDVLGFEIRREAGEIEASSGPVRIQLEVAGYGPVVMFCELSQIKRGTPVTA